MEKLIGKKVRMTQIWHDDAVVPVTVVAVAKDGGVPFKVGDLVKVSGHSKGRGFQGGVKRHGFHGGPKTHGQKNRFRAPGSIGSTAPQRVLPGRRMAGHMGTNRVTVKNIEVVQIADDQKLVFLKGGVPGMRGSKIELS